MRKAPEKGTNFLSAMRVTLFPKILVRPTASNASTLSGSHSYRKNGTLLRLEHFFHSLLKTGAAEIHLEVFRNRVNVEEIPSPRASVFLQNVRILGHLLADGSKLLGNQHSGRVSVNNIQQVAALQHQLLHQGIVGKQGENDLALERLNIVDAHLALGLSVEAPSGVKRRKKNRQAREPRKSTVGSDLSSA
jgi:hypothetical protein